MPRSTGGEQEIPREATNAQAPVADFFDVIVVGGGPAGSEAARAAAGAGLRTLLAEEHPSVGVPSHCTGKLSRHAFAEFDLPASLAVNAVSAAVFHSPGGVSVHVRRAEVDSYVVDRVGFDRWLVGRAAQAGAEVVTGLRIVAASREDGRMVVRGTRRDGREFGARCHLVIDAEGASPRLPRVLGLQPACRYALGLQFQVRGVGGLVADTPEMFFGRDVAPGFFAWLLPLGGTRARIGLCVDPAMASHAPAWYLARLIARHPALSRRMAGAVVEGKVAGRIPLLGGQAPSRAEGMLVAGDAAGQVKATSGGGIYYAMIAGKMAGEAAARYVGGDRAALAGYERGWRRRFGREVSFTAYGRRIINRLSDDELDEVMRIIAEDGRIRRQIETAGDTQFQSRVFFPLLRSLAATALRRPSLLPLVGTALLQGMLAQL